MAGGEAQQVTDEPLDVANLIVSRDGRRIGFTIDVFRGPRRRKQRNVWMRSRSRRPRAGCTTGFRAPMGHVEGRTAHHLFVRDIDGGTSVDVMKDMDADTPSKPFGGPEEMTFTPDGHGVVFAARDAAPALEPVSTNYDLYYAATTVWLCRKT